MSDSGNMGLSGKKAVSREAVGACYEAASSGIMRKTAAPDCRAAEKGRKPEKATLWFAGGDVKRKTRRYLCACAAAFAGIAAAITGCRTRETEEPAGEESSARADTGWEEAGTSPFVPYPELVTYTLGKMTGADNSNMPEGDTYTDNAYTRYLREMIHVQNVDMFEAQDNQYNTNVEMCIATGNMPDIMIVSDQEVLQRMVKSGLVEDLTDAYEACASDRLKEIYASYGDSILESASYQGRLMALPETNIAEGPNLLWLRKDWMDKLGLEEPKTLDDAVEIIRAFLREDPGDNGEGNTVGLVCDTVLTGGTGYSAEYLVDIIFACYGAYPKQWIRNSEGEAVYGSVQPEVKDALKKLNELYEEGILDPNFLLRSTGNIIDLIVEGTCGSFFGPWWAPNNPLMEAVKADPTARWEPYLIATDEDGATSYHSQNPAYKYVVVRKGYEHPEIIFKIASVMFDYIRFEDRDAEEFVNYFQNNVDPTARPLSINVDYRDALDKCYTSLKGALDGEYPVDRLEMLEKSYYDYCTAYLAHPESATGEEWAAYASRIKACALISDGDTREVESLFFGKTLTMNENWWKLEDLEEQAFLKIVAGEEDAEYFDRFVEEWYESSGDEITQEVRKRLNMGAE